MRQITLITTILIALMCSSAFARGKSSHQQTKNKLARAESKMKSRSRSHTRSPAFSGESSRHGEGFRRASMYLRKSATQTY